MIRLAGTITYTDGHTEAVEAVQVEFAAWERYALRAGITVNPEGAPPITMLRYLGYAATQRGKPKPAWDDYDEWDALVLDVQLEGADGLPDAGVPAFPPVRSAG